MCAAIWLLHTLSSIFGVNSEDSRLVDSAMDKARAIGTNIATVHVVHIELQGASYEGEGKAEG